MFVAIEGLMFAMSTRFAASYSSNQKDGGALWEQVQCYKRPSFQRKRQCGQKCRQKWAARPDNTDHDFHRSFELYQT